MIQFIPWFLEEEPRPNNWDDIYAEYIGLRENKSSLYVLGLIKEIAYLKSRYQIVEECCKVMNICFSAKLIDQAKEVKDILRQYNFRFAFDMANEDHFSRDVKAVLSGNKKTITTWQRKEKELDEYQKKHDGKAWQRKDFYIWAVTLTEFMGSRIDLEIITIAEWCMMINKYEKYAEVKNAEYNSKKYGKRK